MWRIMMMAACRNPLGKITLVVLGLVIVSVTHAGEADSNAISASANYQELKSGTDAALEGRCEQALTILQPAINDAAFTSHAGWIQRTALHHFARCASKTGRYALSIPYIEALVELGGVDMLAWLRELVAAGVQSGQPVVAVNAVERLAALDPHNLREIDVYALFMLHGLVNNRDDAGVLKFNFLQTLHEAEYAPAHPFYTADEFMIDYAIMLADRGETDNLNDIVRSFTDPAIYVRVLIDKRFAGVVADPAMAEVLDLNAAAEREIVRVSELVARHPEYAIGRVFLSKAYSAAWRFEDALEVIEPVAWTMLGPDAGDHYVDVEFAKRWVLSNYADTLYRLKYPEQSGAMYQEAVEAPDFDVDSAYKVIDLLGKALYGGFLQEAHDVARALDLSGVTLHHRMWVHSVIVCTNVMGPKISDYSQNEVYLLEHERANPSALIQALMCKNDMERAGRHMVRRLEDPGQRVNGLLYLQYMGDEWESERRSHLHETDEGLSPGHILWHRFDELREREDVTRAVNRVGRLIVVPLHESSWHRY